jgi:sugar porter (SP) family MFS transporter
VSALGSALAPDPYLFAFFRFIGGLGVGASSIAAPIYISEIAPAEQRGKLVATYQFNIVLGILVAFFSNYVIGLFGGMSAWRWMLGIEAVPALIYVALVLRIPESPRWLMMKGNESLARTLLERINPGKSIDALVASIKESLLQPKGNKDSFLSRKYAWPIALAFLVAFFNQLSGINFVLYYAPRIFGEAGIAAESVLGASVPLGIVNLLFTLLGMYLIDRLGRRQLLIIGSIGYILFLSAVSWAFFTNAQGFYVVIFICGFIASHAIGQGAIIWVFISEIFPTSVRDYGMSLGSGTHWVFAALITMITLPVLNAFSGGAIFAFFAGMMILQLAFAFFVMPETKGISLEELQKRLTPRNR